MRISTICLKCAQDSNIKDLCNSFPDYNDGMFTYTCRNGHNNYIRLINNKFELLYDSAIICYYNGQYRECIMNIFSCIESFYEYIIRLLLYAKGNNIIDDVIKSTKQIDKRSEYREGAFFAICKAYLNKDFCIKEKYKSLRNTLIHNGDFTIQQKSYDFAKYIYNFISECYLDVQKLVGKDKIKEFELRFQDYKFRGYDVEHEVVIQTTMLQGGYLEESFENELENFKYKASNNYFINNYCNNNFNYLFYMLNNELNTFEEGLL